MSNAELKEDKVFTNTESQEVEILPKTKKVSYDQILNDIYKLSFITLSCTIAGILVKTISDTFYLAVFFNLIKKLTNSTIKFQLENKNLVEHRENLKLNKEKLLLDIEILKLYLEEQKKTADTLKSSTHSFYTTKPYEPSYPEDFIPFSGPGNKLVDDETSGETPIDLTKDNTEEQSQGVALSGAE